jgi:predicted branched-subunit amino acid permease
MKRDTIRLLNLIQMISEICIAAGYLIGLIPFVYIWSSSWVIPLVFVSLVIALLNKNGTLMFTIANLAMAFLSYIPVVGFLFRLIGAGISVINLRMLRRGNH